MPIHIVIPDERAAQLRQFAASLNISVADAVGELIKDAVAAGKIPDALPGFTIEREGEQVVLDTGAWSTKLTRDLAKGYAEQIRAVARSVTTPGKSNPFMPEFKLGVSRRGTGLKLTDGSGGTKTIAPSIAEDVARLIDKAAE